ncbi:hypothetical protein SAMN04488100_13614 [Alkalibacterium putridalgicola]|uniref:Uncharacterized protein n=1 Tax=Alkalibacterium putridalgicola TaxID=426703 RepID=A0A1H7WLJ9_9LACT|nr:hypothetical protein [Alkalibacterium putridalgicola]GEK90103.1 hypothetical protein APU01nite_21420 [Alkalibacterium putridalgicola]SEM22522.1 hypothetical protein SAMN04488100_13614 [Alkalibacterium putridalgicola]
MTNHTNKSAQGYRVPKIDWKSMIRSVFTLGFKRRPHEQEKAKTYEYVFEDKGIEIAEISLDEKRKVVAYKSLSSVKEKEKIISKGKFEDGDHTYYLDKETIS